jgi:hypothetical protein
MRKLAIVGLLAVSASGCVVRAHGRVDPFSSVLLTGLAVATVANAAVTVSTPPPAVVDVGYYGYYRPGYVWVNGRQTWNGSAWAWTPGYYQTARSNQVWIQGSWQAQGNQWVWVDGYWSQPRSGYVYVDGYYDYTGNGYVWRTGRWEAERPGYVWVNGSWSTGGSGRVWQQGGWRPAATPASMSVRANGGVTVTPR